MYDDICINFCVTVGFFYTGTDIPKSFVNWVRKMPFSISINEKQVVGFGTLRWCIPIFSFHPELSKGESGFTTNRCCGKIQRNVVDRSHCSWLLVVVDVDVNI